MISPASVPLRSARRIISGVDGALVLEVRLHELVVELGDQVDEDVVACLGSLCELGGDVLDGELGSECVRVDDRLHLDEVDDAREVLLGPDRKVDRHGTGAEAVAHRLHGASKSAPVRSILLMNAMRGTL